MKHHVQPIIIKMYVGGIKPKMNIAIIIFLIKKMEGKGKDRAIVDVIGGGREWVS